MNTVIKTLNNVYLFITKSKTIVLEGYSLQGNNDSNSFGSSIFTHTIFSIASTVSKHWPQAELDHITFEKVETLHFFAYTEDDQIKYDNDSDHFITDVITYPSGTICSYKDYSDHMHSIWSKENSVKQLSSNNFIKIIELFNSVDLKKPVLRIAASNQEVSISKAKPHSSNPDHLYVRIDDMYAGKISPEGNFTFTNDQRVVKIIDYETINKCLAELNESPKEKLVEYGRQSGKCGCCGRKLTDSKSIELGIGPICLETWNI